MVASPRSFVPPFCPNARCVFHFFPTGWRFKKAGSYQRLAAPRTVQRYRCLTCSRNFSFQTFQTTYWLKKPHLVEPTFLRVLSCSGFRQIAREFGCSHTTVMRLTERLGRHCLLYQRRYRPPCREPLVIDGFESFEYSQYHPCHFHLAVGSETHWLYAFTDSELRRKGRMTSRQKRKRELLEAHHGRPDPKSIEKEVAALLELIPGHAPLTLLSDEHPAYPRAVRRVGTRRIRHFVTSSKDPRTPQNPLFPVNLTDLLLRHGGANHKRETIAFSKRRQGAAERLAIFQVWRNFLKHFSERKRDATPAQRIGVMSQMLTATEVLAERLFPSRVRLPNRLEVYYRRETPTRMIPHFRRHRCVYAD